jgi:sigma-E factor negative regulatory protein RseB
MTVNHWCKNLKLAAFIAAIFAHGPLVAEQIKSAYDLVRGTAKAAKELNYRGVFTYEFRGTLRSIKVVHLVRDGQTYEHIVHMDGDGHEIVRRGDDVGCTRPAEMLLLGTDFTADSSPRLDDLYSFYIRGNARIAGRMAYMVEIRPKDKLRYGYVVAIDKLNGLMLQSMLISQSGKPLERFQYVDISFPSELDNIQLPEQLVNSQQAPGCLESYEAADASVSKWQPTWLPSGFVLSDIKIDSSTGDESWIYTDGLALFSVFIDSAEKSRRFPPVDAKLGTTVAVLSKVTVADQHYAICVVGEIPDATARQIAASISPLASTIEGAVQAIK